MIYTNQHTLSAFYQACWTVSKKLWCSLKLLVTKLRFGSRIVSEKPQKVKLYLLSYLRSLLFKIIHSHLFHLSVTGPFTASILMFLPCLPAGHTFQLYLTKCMVIDALQQQVLGTLEGC